MSVRTKTKLWLKCICVPSLLAIMKSMDLFTLVTGIILGVIVHESMNLRVEYN